MTMCFPLPAERILSRGEHAGHEFVVTHNGMGSRCGYVKVGPGHPWYGKEEWEIPDDDVSVHGGLTFAQADTPCDVGGPDDGYWLGFDCAHSIDAPDPSLAMDSQALGYARIMAGHGTIRTQEYVEAECRSLCEQARLAAVGVSR